MKYLFNMFVAMVFVLSSCINVPESTQENTPSITSLSEVPQVAPTNSIEIVGGDEESTLEFLKQWLMPINPDGLSQNLKIYIASMPKDLPYDLPVSDDLRIIGSVTGSWVDYIFIFDTKLSSEPIHDFYAQTLSDMGWHEAPTNQGQGGFVTQFDYYHGYCHEDNDAFLSVETTPLTTEKTSIRLSLDISPAPYNCDPVAASPGFSYSELIPQLVTPRGSFIQSGGASSSDQSAEVTASLQSDLSTAELVELYNQQLLASGWIMQDSGDTDDAAWSHWAFTDEQENKWLGQLIVLKTSGKSDRLFALIRIEKDN